MHLLGRLGDRGGAGRRRTGPNRRRAGAGGLGPGADPCWRSIHVSVDGGDTPRASGHCLCDLHMHMYRYDRAEVVLTLFRSNRFQRCRYRFERRNKGVSNIRCCIQALNSTNVCFCFTSASGPKPLAHRATKIARRYLSWLQSSIDNPTYLSPSQRKYLVKQAPAKA
jgi:hypothetical protein